MQLFPIIAHINLLIILINCFTSKTVERKQGIDRGREFDIISNKYRRDHDNKIKVDY